MQRRTALSAMAAGLMAGMIPLGGQAQGARAPTGYLRTNWSGDPFALGAYSYVPRGARQRDRDILAAPVENRVLFAGEAAHPNYNSTVHAAYESGLMAADAVSDTAAGRVLVIGAGMAGLAAASALDRRGYEVEVLEARDRLGGRIWTDDSAFGAPADLGASWIHGIDGNPLVALAEANGVALIGTGDDWIARGPAGEIAWRDLPDWIDDATDTWITAGVEADRLNRAAYLAPEDYGGPDVVLSQGYAPLINSLARGLDIHLGRVVTEVLWGGADVTVRHSGGENQADAVIVTLPLSVLQAGSVQFTPELPGEKQDAIARLGMGLLDKLYLGFDAVFWDDATWIVTPGTGLPPGQFNTWLNFDRVFGVPVLLAFNGATPARDLAGLSDPEHLSRAVSVLERAYPV